MYEWGLATLNVDQRWNRERPLFGQSCQSWTGHSGHAAMTASTFALDGNFRLKVCDAWSGTLVFQLQSNLNRDLSIE